MSEKVRFNQHPVISVLLWILGTESNLHVNDTYNNNNSNNAVKHHHVDDVEHIPHGILKWKDDQGGNIHEYMSQVQLTRPIVVVPTTTTVAAAAAAAAADSQDSKETTTQLKPESAKEESRRLAKSDSDDKSGDIYDSSRYSDSPQWGFYVSM